MDSVLQKMIKSLTESGEICRLFIWTDEPTRFSWSRIVESSDDAILVLVFNPEGLFEGMRIVPIMYVHKIHVNAGDYSIDDRQSILAEEAATEFAGCSLFEKFIEKVADSGELCELYTNDMEEHLGKVIECDEDNVLVSHFDEEDLVLRGEILLRLDDIHYFWARSRKCQSRNRLLPKF